MCIKEILQPGYTISTFLYTINVHYNLVLIVRYYPTIISA